MLIINLYILFLDSAALYAWDNKESDIQESDILYSLHIIVPIIDILAFIFCIVLCISGPCSKKRCCIDRLYTFLAISTLGPSLSVVIHLPYILIAYLNDATYASSIFIYYTVTIFILFGALDLSYGTCIGALKYRSENPLQNDVERGAEQHAPQDPPVNEQHAPQDPPVNEQHAPQDPPVNEQHAPQDPPVNEQHAPQDPPVNEQHAPQDPPVNEQHAPQDPPVNEQHAPQDPPVNEQHAPQDPPVNEQHAPQDPPVNEQHADQEGLGNDDNPYPLFNNCSESDIIRTCAFFIPIFTFVILLLLGMITATLVLIPISKALSDAPNRLFGFYQIFIVLIGAYFAYKKLFHKNPSLESVVEETEENITGKSWKGLSNNEKLKDFYSHIMTIAGKIDPNDNNIKKRERQQTLL